MKKILTVCVCFVTVYCTAYSDGDLEKIISADYNGSISSNQMLRLNFSMFNSQHIFREVRFFELNYCSLASQYDGKKVRISSNFIATAVGMGSNYLLRNDTSSIGMTTNIILHLPVLVHLFSNPSFKFTLYSFRNKNRDGYHHAHSDDWKDYEQNMGIYLILNVKTDYYLLNDIARIYSEGKIGLKIKYYDTAIETHLGIPFTKGYFENKTPYFGISAMYYFESQFPW